MDWGLLGQFRDKEGDLRDLPNQTQINIMLTLACQGTTPCIRLLLDKTVYMGLKDLGHPHSNAAITNTPVSNISQPILPTSE